MDREGSDVTVVKTRQGPLCKNETATNWCLRASVKDEASELTKKNLRFLVQIPHYMIESAVFEWTTDTSACSVSRLLAKKYAPPAKRTLSPSSSKLKSHIGKLQRIFLSCVFKFSFLASLFVVCQQQLTFCVLASFLLADLLPRVVLTQLMAAMEVEVGVVVVAVAVPVVQLLVVRAAEIACPNQCRQILMVRATTKFTKNFSWYATS